MDFEIFLTGLNHKTAGVDIREKYSLAPFCGPENWAFANVPGLRESLILSTCNRVEVLGIGGAGTGQGILEAWLGCAGGQKKELAHHLYTHMGMDAVRHVFNVACSLDSMVVGEPQILGQFKQAYRHALASRNAGPIINRLMHTAFFVAKRVRNETSIGVNAVSISYAAVELARCIFDNLGAYSVLLLGAGEMAELAALNLVRAGIGKLLIANRTYANAEQLAAKYGGSAVAFSTLEEQLGRADIVIASTGASKPVITRELAEKTLRARKNRPIFMIDIAVPRNIEPEVNSLDNIYLYDIDDLRETVEKNRIAREKEAQAAAKIIDEETLFFENWLKNLELQPTILDLIRRSDQAAEIEVKKTMRRLGSNSPELKEALEKMARSLSARLNYAPLAWLKKGGMNGAKQAERISTLRNVFALDSPGDQQEGLEK